MNIMKQLDPRTFRYAGEREGIEAWVIVDSEPCSRFMDYFLTEDEVWIVLQTKENDTAYSIELTHNIHVWLGACSVPADAACAARRAAELDLRLRRRAGLHWERQGHECPLFAGYFGSSLHYLPGKYEDIYYAKTYSPGNQLFMLHSCEQIVRTKRVECDMFSLNTRDPCILVSEELMYVFPRGSWHQHRLLSIADNIRFRETMLRRHDDAHNIRGAIILGPQPREDDNCHPMLVSVYANEEDWDNFYEMLGWKDKNSFPLLPDGEPPQIGSPAPTKLYEIRRNRKGRVYYDTIRQPFQREYLDSQGLFILTNDKDDINLWIGKKNQDRNKAKLYGLAKIKEYMARSKLSSWNHMAIIPEGLEPMKFKEQFQNWVMD